MKLKTLWLMDEAKFRRQLYLAHAAAAAESQLPCRYNNRLTPRTCLALLYPEQKCVPLPYATESKVYYVAQLPYYDMLHLS